MDNKHRENQPQSRRKPMPARRRRTAPAKQEQTAPEVVYQPAQHFNRNRLILMLVTVAAVVLAVLTGISVFFKVEKHSVNGCNKYSAEQIWEASGIQNGENLLTLGIPKAAAKIIEELPYVESVRIMIKLPNVVHIEVVESEVVYAVQENTSAWWLVNSSGKVLDRVPAGSEGKFTKLIGVQIQSPVPGNAAAAYENGSSVTPEAQRLQIALNIVQYLEQNQIVGTAASVDVSDMSNLNFWYGKQYHVKLGNDENLLYKVSYFKGYLDRPKADPNESGELDLSFTASPDQGFFNSFGK